MTKFIQTIQNKYFNKYIKMTKFIQTIQNKYFNNEIVKNINNTTNVLGVYGATYGLISHAFIESDNNYNKTFSKDTHKDFMIKSYKVCEAGIYGGVVWGVFGKTFPIFLPIYSFYKGL